MRRKKDRIANTVKKTAAKAKEFGYKQAGVSNFNELKEKLGVSLKDPKTIALFAAVVILQDSLVFGGMAAYNALKASGKLSG